MDSIATLSPCQKYRYHLGRRWNKDGHACVFVMLNPSTADASIDDPTIRKCVAYAKQWGCGELHVFNLFAFRATNPDALLRVANPVGDANYDYIRKYMRALIDDNLEPIVICAWGSQSYIGDHGKQMLARLQAFGVRPMALKINKDGNPTHPLYQKMTTIPLPYRLTA